MEASALQRRESEVGGWDGESERKAPETSDNKPGMRKDRELNARRSVSRKGFWKQMYHFLEFIKFHSLCVNCASEYVFNLLLEML